MSDEIVRVTSVQCSIHGEISNEIAPKDWDGTATVRLLRQRTVHHYKHCQQQIMWATEPLPNTQTGRNADE